MLQPIRAWPAELDLRGEQPIYRFGSAPPVHIVPTDCDVALPFPYADCLPWVAMWLRNHPSKELFTVVISHKNRPVARFGTLNQAAEFCDALRPSGARWLTEALLLARLTD